MTGEPKALPDAVVQRAAEWMARLWSGEATAAEQAACARWRATHPDHELAWQRLQGFEQQLAGVPPTVARHALRLPSVRGRRRALQVLGVGALAGGLAYVGQQSTPVRTWLAGYRSAPGEIRHVVLPDGTQVVMDTDSAFDLAFSASERLVILHAGTILLTSAPQALPGTRPLRVQTRQGMAQAIGTRFAVRQDTTDTQVQVFEGAVRLQPAAQAEASLTLVAGQGARLTSTQVQAVQPLAPQADAWVRSELVVDDQPLGTVLDTLARYRSGWLRYDPAVAGLRVSAVLPLHDTDRALHNLTLALPLRLRYRTRYWVSVEPG